MQLPNKNLIISVLAGLCAGGFLMAGWQHYSYPSRPLFVEITNTLPAVLPIVKIEHGNDFIQEKILLTQLRAGETRLLTLNHEPQRGYSVEAQLPDGSKTEACVGKMTSSWVNHVIISENGIYNRN